MDKPTQSSPMMLNLRLRRVRLRRERLMPLLMQADAGGAMTARWLHRCELYGLFVDRRVPVSLACVTEETAAFAPGGAAAALAPELMGARVMACRSLVTAPEFRGRGFAAQLLMRLCGMHDVDHDFMIAGVGDVPSLRRFYERCGFRERFRRPGYFTGRCPQPLRVEGVPLEDMVVYGRRIRRDDPDPVPWGAFMRQGGGRP